MEQIIQLAILAIISGEKLIAGAQQTIQAAQQDKPWTADEQAAFDARLAAARKDPAWDPAQNV